MAQLDQLQRRAQEVSEEHGHYYLGTEHFVLASLRDEPYLAEILRAHSVDADRFVKRILEIADYGDGSPIWAGCPVTPRLTKILKLAEREARDNGASEIASHYIVAAILREGLGIPARVLAEFKIPLAVLRSEVLKRAPQSSTQPRTKRSDEGPADLADILAEEDKQPKGLPRDRKTDGGGKPPKKSVLGDYGRNLTLLAAENLLEPVVGRQEEIRRCLQILTRKTKNNPVLIGEAGVGKSSVAYGLAQRIAAGRVPEILRHKELWELSMNRIVAGAAYKGEFQERLQKMMDEVASRPDVILFIDEIHMIVGAGDNKGGMDASNILKPALSRGEFPVIGASTTDEYRKTIEKDPALERRFQPVLVSEPSEAECLQILNGLRPRYENHHKVQITDRALLAAIKLSVRYLPDRYLPDKAIDIIDEAASKVKLQQVSMSISPESPPSFEVTEDVVAEVVSDWAQVPVSRLTEEEGERLLHIEDNLRSRVIGQDDAVRTISETIRVMRMGLGNPNRPGGVFLFLGPTGVGKTELARALAEVLFGSEKDLIRIDMSEYMEKHATSRMIGSPPGYVGHEEEGQLTRQVRTRPYSVVLMDEVEKAHPEVFDLFLQVFDDGRLTDSKGRTVNFTNTIIIMTSNIGTTPGETPPDPDDAGYREHLMEAVQKKFRPEFINRIDEIIPFRPLSSAALDRILDLQLSAFTKLLRETRRLVLALEPGARALLMQKGYSPLYGARPLKRAVESMLVKALAEEILRSNFKAGDIVTVRAQGDHLVFARTDLAAPPVDEPKNDKKDDDDGDMSFWDDNEP